MNIRMPHITGKTVPEQITQIVSYLRELAMQLRMQPEQAQAPQAVSVVEESAARSRFGKLKAQSINGIWLRSVRVWETSFFRIQSEYADWDTGGNRQSFLLSGCMQHTPVLGVIRLSSNGEVAWSGTEGVSVSTEAGGIVVVQFASTVYDYFLVQSPEKFEIR